MSTIPFFLTLIIKCFLTMVHHITNKKTKKIYTAFNEVYIYYRKWGFSIITLHTNGEFAPLQEMIIKDIPGGPNMHPTRVNEHVLDI